MFATSSLRPCHHVSPQAVARNVTAASTAFDAGNLFQAACISSGRDEGACTLLAKDVASSIDGNLGKRPAALCYRLAECDPALQCNGSYTSAGTTTSGALDLCTATGLVNGPAVSRACELCTLGMTGGMPTWASVRMHASSIGCSGALRSSGCHGHSECILGMLYIASHLKACNILTTPLPVAPAANSCAGDADCAAASSQVCDMTNTTKVT